MQSAATPALGLLLDSEVLDEWVYVGWLTDPEEIKTRAAWCRLCGTTKRIHSAGLWGKWRIKLTAYSTALKLLKYITLGSSFFSTNSFHAHRGEVDLRNYVLESMPLEWTPGATACRVGRVHVPVGHWQKLFLEYRPGFFSVFVWCRLCHRFHRGGCTVIESIAEQASLSKFDFALQNRRIPGPRFVLHCTF